MSKVKARRLRELLNGRDGIGIWVTDRTDPTGMAKRPEWLIDAYSDDVRRNSDPADPTMTVGRWVLWFAQREDEYVPGQVTHGDFEYTTATREEYESWVPREQPTATVAEQRPAYTPDPLAVEATEAGREAGRRHAAWADAYNSPMHESPDVPARFATVETYYTAAYDDGVTAWESEQSSV